MTEMLTIDIESDGLIKDELIVENSNTKNDKMINQPTKSINKANIKTTNKIITKEDLGVNQSKTNDSILLTFEKVAGIVGKRNIAKLVLGVSGLVASIMLVGGFGIYHYSKYTFEQEIISVEKKKQMKLKEEELELKRIRLLKEWEEMKAIHNMIMASGNITPSSIVVTKASIKETSLTSNTKITVSSIIDPELETTIENTKVKEKEKPVKNNGLDIKGGSLVITGEKFDKEEFRRIINEFSKSY